MSIKLGFCWFCCKCWGINQSLGGYSCGDIEDEVDDAEDVDEHVEEQDEDDAEKEDDDEDSPAFAA